LLQVLVRKELRCRDDTTRYGTPDRPSKASNHENAVPVFSPDITGADEYAFHSAYHDFAHHDFAHDTTDNPPYHTIANRS